jgi:hypothetical protein
MIDEQQARYADLIECSARVLAFDGLVDAALPGLVSALTSEAVDLRNGWLSSPPMTCPARLTCRSSTPSLLKCSPAPMLCGAKFLATCVVPRRQMT